MKYIISGIMAGILTIWGLFWLFSLGYQNEQTITCKVSEKWIKSYGNSSQVYLVSCGKKVYEISDLLFKGKFNSSDIYANIKPNKTYKITTTGYRNGFFTMYQNINKVEIVK